MLWHANSNKILNLVVRSNQSSSTSFVYVSNLLVNLCLFAGFQSIERLSLRRIRDPQMHLCPIDDLSLVIFTILSLVILISSLLFRFLSVLPVMVSTTLISIVFSICFVFEVSDLQCILLWVSQKLLLYVYCST